MQRIYSISTLFLSACFLLLTLTQCASSQQTETEEPLTVPEEMMEDLNIEDEFKGRQAIEGPLSITKGGRAMINGIMVTDDEFLETMDENWRGMLEEMEGKTVKAHGDWYRHWCAPMEQCLQQGYIDRLEKLELFELVEE